MVDTNAILFGSVARRALVRCSVVPYYDTSYANFVKNRKKNSLPGSSAFLDSMDLTLPSEASQVRNDNGQIVGQKAVTLSDICHE